MNKTNNALTKTCNSCGEIKPLSAFLQLSGTEGTTYSNICSSCRKTEIEKAKQKEKDDLSTTSIGHKIDAKVRVKDVFDKRKLHQETQEEYFEERDKVEEKETRKEKFFETVRKDEKEKREFRSFLDNSKKTTTRPVERVFGGEEHRAAEGKIDLAGGPFQDTHIAGKLKYTQSSVFSEFKKRVLGGAAPINSAEERVKNTQANQADKNKKAVTDFVKENLEPTTSPSSTRRR